MYRKYLPSALMWKIVLLLVLGASDLDAAGSKFNPKKHDYCKKNWEYCPEGAEHTACWCKVIPPRVVVKTQMKEFRQAMEDVHNLYRNEIANGDTPGYPSASNMLVVSYNYELEYITDCHAGKFNDSHDVCRNLSNNSYSGQNLTPGFGNKKNPRPVERPQYAVYLAKAWWNEWKDANVSDIRNFTREKANNKYIAHFTQFVWADMDRVGCSRTYNPSSKLWPNVLLCNYYNTQGWPANMVTLASYKEGKPASDCPNGIPPSKRYPALCSAPLSSEITHKIIIFLGILVTIPVLY